jgi:mono/diheme cytochrome c family protein
MRWTILAVFVAGIVTWGWLGAAPTRFVPHAAAAAEQDEWLGMPASKGREETFSICSACHSIRLVIQQGLDRGRWADAIDWMVEEQEMEKLDPYQLKLILDYLAKWYGPDRKARALKR